MSHLLAARMSAVRPSPTVGLGLKLQMLRETGRDIVNLGQGELDFPTPDHVAEAGIRAIREGRTRYTPTSGTAELKEAIAHKFRRDNGLSFAPSQIIAGTGAKQLLHNALLATVEAGDEAVIPTPCWVSYPDMVRLAGGTPVLVETTAAEGWKLTPAALEAALTSRTKWLVLNSPSNPTGALYSEPELAALLEVIEDHHTLVIADDIYESIVHEGRFATPAAVRPDLSDRILTVNGVSKGQAMTGWRLGYAAGPEWLVRAMDILQSQSTSNPSSISQAAAAAALMADPALIADRLPRLTARRDAVLKAIAAMPGLSAAPAPGAFYVFASCADVIGARTPEGEVITDDLEVADYLLEAADVAVVPGSAFAAPGHLRLAYAIDDVRLAEAMERMTSALNDLTYPADIPA